MANMEKVKSYSIPLTEREYSLLAVIVTELEVAGFSPYDDMFCVQVDSCINWDICVCRG